jgi:hypothetical protein
MRAVVRPAGTCDRGWALRVPWDLCDGGPRTFRELRRCGEVSSSVLNDRLRELRGPTIIALGPGGGEVLTADGQDPIRVLMPLDARAKQAPKSNRRS